MAGALTALSHSDEVEAKLMISQSSAERHFNKCGSIIQEPVVEYTESRAVKDNSVVQAVLNRAQLTFQPEEFQLKTWNSICNKDSVVLTAPCSSGKMLTAELSVDIMRELTGVPDGVGLGILPLSAIMRETIKKNKQVAFMTMEGDIESGEEGTEKICFSDTMENLVEGKYKVILGHVESLDSDQGRALLEALEEKGQLVFVFIDEVHKFLPSQWGRDSFRKDMSVVPASVRTQTVAPWVPILAMTATLTVGEVTEVKEMLCIKDDKLVVITSSPVQPQHKIYNVLRPNSFYRSVNGDPGTKELLDRLILRQFDNCIVKNSFQHFSRTIIFIKHIKEGIEINDLLTYRYKSIPVFNRPWIFNHSGKKSVSSHKMEQLLENETIQLIVCSPKLLMGVNLSKFRIAIMLGPYEAMADILQALGRTGRREEGGRALSILYNCWNKTDLSRNTSNSVIDFCHTKKCLKSFSHKFFTGEDNIFGGYWCCSNCDE